MVRKVIKIDEDKCVGCGLCAQACHESAIAIVDGKARLLRDDYCDGLGNCLPACPTNAISFEEREAAAYDKEAVEKHKMKQEKTSPQQKKETEEIDSKSQLASWPVQLKLVNPQAEIFDNSHLLIAADCAAYAHGNFHNKFMKGRVTLIGCPKLDEVDYSEKLTEILIQNNIKSITIVRMEVPCCGGLAQAAVKAWSQAGSFLPLRVCILKTNGEVIEEQYD